MPNTAAVESITKTESTVYRESREKSRAIRGRAPSKVTRTEASAATPESCQNKKSGEPKLAALFTPLNSNYSTVTDFARFRG
jgi:hypothetical protein